MVLVVAGFWLVLVAILVSAGIRKKVADWFAENNRAIWILPAWFVVMWPGNSSGILMAGIYFAVPTLIVYLFGPRKDVGTVGLLEIIIIALLWLPVELRIMMKNAGGNYPLTAYCALIFVLIIMTGWRKIDWSLDWSFRLKDLAMVAGFFLLLASVLIPLGLQLNFLGQPIIMNPKLAKELPGYPWTIPVVLGLLWFTPALVEEIIFRGVIQNFFTERLKPIYGIAIASMIFGAAHVNNKTAAVIYGVKYEYDFPNWRYVVMAAIAGLVYGSVYHLIKKRGSANALGMAALIHALVDFVWLLALKGGG